MPLFGLFDNVYEAFSVLYPFIHKRVPETLDNILIYLPFVYFMGKLLKIGANDIISRDPSPEEMAPFEHLIMRDE